MTPHQCHPTCPGWAVYNEGEPGMPKGEVQACLACGRLSEQMAVKRARAAGLGVADDGLVL